MDPFGERAMPTAIEFLTAGELAVRLGLTLDTIRRWTRDDLIPAIRVTAKVVRYDPVEVERALRERSQCRHTSRREARPR